MCLRTGVALRFVDRRGAGELLALRLAHLRNEDIVVEGLPRGGIPVAYEVAKSLNVPLDVIVVRKLGAPSQPELAIGAVGEGGIRVVDPAITRSEHLDDKELDEITRRESEEVRRQVERLRKSAGHIDLTGRIALIVDDGVATGATARAACQIARAQGARSVIVAVPVAPARVQKLLADVADEVVCLETPRRFFAVGEHYADFAQVPDSEVVNLLETRNR